VPQPACADKLHLLTISIDDDRLLKSVGASATCDEQQHSHKRHVLAISIDDDRLPEFADNRPRISRHVLRNCMSTNGIR
jgi:hypothetical protein